VVNSVQEGLWASSKYFRALKSRRSLRSPSLEPELETEQGLQQVSTEKPGTSQGTAFK